MNGRARFVVLAAVLAGLSATYVAISLFGSDGNQPTQRSNPADTSDARAGVLFPSPEAPLLFGLKSTLEQAEAKAGFHLYRPDHVLAKDALINDVWFEETSTDDEPWMQVAITYSSGLRMYLLPAWVDGMDKNPESQYESRADEFPGSAEAKVIGGNPALVVEKTAPNRPAAVDLVVEGVRVQIVGGDAPVDGAIITQIAATLR